VTLLPLVAGISVQPPSAAFGNQPFSLPFQMTNDSPLPALYVEYSCDLDEAKLFSSHTRISNAKARFAAAARTLWWHETMTARCENAYRLPDDVESARYTLRIRYLALPWPWKRLGAWTFTPIIDRQNHRIAKWVPE
jgi:hypothetical protein